MKPEYLAAVLDIKGTIMYESSGSGRPLRLTVRIKDSRDEYLDCFLGFKIKPSRSKGMVRWHDDDAVKVLKSVQKFLVTAKQRDRVSIVLGPGNPMTKRISLRQSAERPSGFWRLYDKPLTPEYVAGVFDNRGQMSPESVDLVLKDSDIPLLLNARYGGVRRRGRWRLRSYEMAPFIRDIVEHTQLKQNLDKMLPGVPLKDWKNEPEILAALPGTIAEVRAKTGLGRSTVEGCLRDLKLRRVVDFKHLDSENGRPKKLYFPV